jgi:hypothetical protein
MSQHQSSIARSTIALMIVVLASSAAASFECYSSAPRDHRHWSWRQIDGRRCWYPGLPGVSKSTLHWSRTSIPSQMDRKTDGSAMAQPPSPERDQEEEILLESVWPPLLENSFEERFVGTR